MDIKDFGREEKSEELSFELEGVQFYLKDLSFGQLLNFQKKIKQSYEVDTEDEEYKNLNVATESASELLNFIVNAVTRVEGLTRGDEKIEELTIEILEEFPAELINEIFVKMNEVYSGNQSDVSKKK